MGVYDWIVRRPGGFVMAYVTLLGFDENPPVERLTRNGTIEDYLRNERPALITRLNTFVTEAVN